MTVKSTSAIERIARVIAGERLSANAEGKEDSAGPEVDAAWQQYGKEVTCPPEGPSI